jgi:hypothetical protein
VTTIASNSDLKNDMKSSLLTQNWLLAKHSYIGSNLHTVTI